MTVSVESWNTIRAYSPVAGCTGLLGDLARAGDVASIANAVEAGLAETGDSDLKVERFSHIMTLLTTDKLRELERDRAEAVARQWSERLGLKFPALLALGAAAESPSGDDRRIDFLLEIGTDPYERIFKKGFLHDDGTEFGRDESAVECLLRIAVERKSGQATIAGERILGLAQQLLGSSPITSADELPACINLNHAIEETKDSPLSARYVNMDVLCAAAVADLPGLVQFLQDRIDVQRHPDAQEIYYRMGDLTLTLMGISFDDVGQPKYEPDQLPMAFHETDYQLANQLIAYGAQFRQGRPGLEAAVARPVDREYSAAFTAANGWTTMCGSLATEQRFLQRMFDEGFAGVNDVENGKTMLTRAVEAGSLDMAEFLIERGADPRTVPPGSPDTCSFPLAREQMRQMLNAAKARAAINDVISNISPQPGC
jgi:hypothetical protein